MKNCKYFDSKWFQIPLSFNFRGLLLCNTAKFLSNRPCDRHVIEYYSNSANHQIKKKNGLKLLYIKLLYIVSMQRKLKFSVLYKKGKIYGTWMAQSHFRKRVECIVGIFCLMCLMTNSLYSEIQSLFFLPTVDSSRGAAFQRPIHQDHRAQTKSIICK
jgi:hypothetical protein